MKTKVIVVLALLIGNALWFSGFFVGRNTHLSSTPEHKHQWGMWGDPDPDENNHAPQFIQFRHCTNCGLAEFRVIEQQK